jgi:hypothetical protein
MKQERGGDMAPEEQSPENIDRGPAKRHAWMRTNEIENRLDQHYRDLEDEIVTLYDLSKEDAMIIVEKAREEYYG